MHSNPSPISFRRAFGIIIPLCLTALMLGGTIIMIANDAYAFIKPDEEISISISSSLSVAEFSKLLQDKSVIKNSFAFDFYVRSTDNADSISVLTGTWTLNSNMSYREILSVFL